jgi:hypothetical protein
MRTSLSGAPIQGKTPKGGAEFRADSVRLRSSLKVEVENVNLPAGTTLNVTLERGTFSQPEGQITLDAFGEGELELNTQDGDNVPAVQTGDVVKVFNDTAVILIGVF